jgi:hypothetical protein
VVVEMAEGVTLDLDVFTIFSATARPIGNPKTRF